MAVFTVDVAYSPPSDPVSTHWVRYMVEVGDPVAARTLGVQQAAALGAIVTAVVQPE
jgi:hypothetical protein